MPDGYQVLDASTLSQLHDPSRDFAYDVLIGLSQPRKGLSSRYFYDDAGSEYFRQIMDLPEYYPTDCEREILTAHATDIVGIAPARPLDVVDLGAGDGAKTMILLESLAAAGADYRYVPIDISEGAMVTLVESVRRRMPDAPIHGLVGDYTDGLHWLGAEHGDRCNLVLFLGSNIGNFDRARSRAFLHRMWNELREGDHVLIGFDLKKDIDILLRAYNDSRGVTAAFNLNVLRRINRELGGEFDLSQFRHFGTYDVFSGAMESYLVSLERQTVYIEALRQSFEFEPWEPIHTEYSYKYLRSDAHSLAVDTGFAVKEDYVDERGWFMDSLWQVEKEAPPR